MGFLDNSTNNIIVDAVLTDHGRKLLARNDGSFTIVFFSLADDEVNYNIIPQFGRMVGKEKIAKNTPVFEAVTGDHSLQFPLQSFSNVNLRYIPGFTVTGGGITSTSQTVSMSRRQAANTTTIKKQIVIEQNQADGSMIDRDVIDQSAQLEWDPEFLVISNAPPATITPNGTAFSILTRASALNGQNGAVFNLGLVTNTISDTQFTISGNYSDKTTITTYVKITGTTSGATTTVQVNISKT